MANYDSIDTDWTWDGDYQIGQDGDLKDTSYDYLQSLRNEMHTIMRSEFGDWELNPNVGANLSEFRGEPNTREMGAAMEDRIITRMVAADIIEPGDIQVRVVPVGIHSVMVTLVVNATSTVANSLSVGEPLATAFLYDSLEDSVFFLAVSKTEHDFRSA